MSSRSNNLEINISANSQQAQRELRNVSQRINSALDSKKITGHLSATGAAIKAAFSVNPVKEFSSSLETAVGTVGKFAGALAAVTAGIAAMGGLRSSIDGIVQKGADLDTLARKLRISAKEAKVLQGTLSMGSGIDANKFAQAMARLNNSLRSNSKTAQETKSMLESLGVSYRDAEGKILPASRLMDNLAKGFKKAELAGYETEYMMQMFGFRAEGLMETFQKWEDAKSKFKNVDNPGLIQYADPKPLAELKRNFDILDAQAAKFKMALGEMFVPLAQDAVPVAIAALKTLAHFISEYKKEIASALGIISHLAIAWASQKTIMAVVTGVTLAYRTALAAVTQEHVAEGAAATEATAQTVEGNEVAQRSLLSTATCVENLTRTFATVTIAATEMASAYEMATLRIQAQAEMFANNFFPVTTHIDQLTVKFTAFGTEAPAAIERATASLNTVSVAIERLDNIIMSLTAQWRNMAQAMTASSGEITTANRAILQGLNADQQAVTLLEQRHRQAFANILREMQQTAAQARDVAASFGSIAAESEVTGYAIRDSFETATIAAEGFSGAISEANSIVSTLGERANVTGTAIERSTTAATASIARMSESATAASIALSSMGTATAESATAATTAINTETASIERLSAAESVAGTAGTTANTQIDMSSVAATEAINVETASVERLAESEAIAGSTAVRAQNEACAAHINATNAINNQTLANERLTAAEVAAGNAGATAGAQQATGATIATRAVNILNGAVSMLKANWLLVAWACYEAISALQEYQIEKLEAEKGSAVIQEDNGAFYYEKDTGDGKKLFKEYNKPESYTRAGILGGGIIQRKTEEEVKPLMGGDDGAHRNREYDNAIEKIRKKQGKGNPIDNIQEPDLGGWNPLSEETGTDTEKGGGSSGADDAAKKADEALKELNKTLADLNKKIFEFDATNFEKSLASIDDEAAKVKETIAKAQENGLDTTELEASLVTWTEKATNEAEKALQKAQEALGFDVRQMIAQTSGDALRIAKEEYDRAWAMLDGEIEAKKKELMRNAGDESALAEIEEWATARKEQINKQYFSKKREAELQAFSRAVELANAEVDISRMSTSVRDALNRTTWEKEIAYLERVLEYDKLTTDERVSLTKRLAEAKKAVHDTPITDHEAVMKGLDALKDSFGTYYEGLEDMTVSIGNAMSDAFETSFFDAMQGNLKSLAEYITSFLQSVQKAIASFMAQQLSRRIISGLFPGNAVGGFEPIGSTFLVGENGPELVNLSGAGAQITSTHTTQRKLRDGGTPDCNVVVNVVNESGTPVNAEQSNTTFDGEKYIVGVVLSAYSKNTMGMRDMIHSR